MKYNHNLKIRKDNRKGVGAMSDKHKSPVLPREQRESTSSMSSDVFSSSTSSKDDLNDRNKEERSNKYSAREISMVDEAPIQTLTALQMIQPEKPCEL